MTTVGRAIVAGARPLLADRIDGVLFDLDDTLFDHMHFLEGAFRAAAAEYGPQRAERLAAAMVTVTRELGSGCGCIFEEALARMELDAGEDRVQRMARAFAAHQPDRLSCFPGVVATLEALSARWPLALVTDGAVDTQTAKLTALGIGRYFTAVIVSDALGGPAARKPSAAPYLAALAQLGVRPERALYVGDNPGRDFAGARALGMITVRVLTGEFRHVTAESYDEADVVIASVADLPANLR